MDQLVNREDLIKRYLLGEMPDDERVPFEAQYFSQDDLFEELLAAEDDLIDDYARDELSPHERGRFERYFLTSPKRHQRVEFAKTMIGSVCRPQESEAPVRPPPSLAHDSWWQSFLSLLRGDRKITALPLAAALALVVLGGAGLGLQAWRLRQQLGEIQAQRLPERLERERSERAKLEQEVARLRTQSASGPNMVPQPGQSRSDSVLLALTTGMVRSSEDAGSGERNKLTIYPGLNLIALQLKLAADDYQSYQARVQTDEEADVLIQHLLKAEDTGGGKAVVVGLSARRLPAGDYIVKLSGIKPDGSLADVGKYYFKVRDQ